MNGFCRRLEVEPPYEFKEQNGVYLVFDRATGEIDNDNLSEKEFRSIYQPTDRNGRDERELYND